jgi:dTDP-glucose 4,6-dehydratase
MTTTLVTGGAGFIGSNFVEMLWDAHKDEKIVVLDAFTYAASPDNIPEAIKNDKRFTLIKGNICDSEIVDKLVGQADHVIHFAAESHVTRSIHDDTPFFKTDVMGTQTIASAISRHLGKVKKFIHISTSEVYGTNESSVGMSEQHPLNPCTPYAAAKAGADRLVYAYQITYGIPTVIIRPFNNYGGRQHLEKVVPRFITAALLGEPLTIHGRGNMTRDWIFVEDTCRAVLAALESKNAIGEIINVGTGSDHSVYDIAAMILQMTKSKSIVTHMAPRPGQVDCHIATTAKAKLLLGWDARVKLEEGMARTIEWYKANPAWWDRQRHIREIQIVDSKKAVVGSF